jgi:hypothetical protein
LHTMPFKKNKPIFETFQNSFCFMRYIAVF